jgi:hypothetical protein
MQVHRPHHTLSVVAHLVLFTACASLPLTSLAAGSITIAKQAPYAQQLSVPDAVRAECNLPIRVTEFVKENAVKSYDKVALADNVSASTPGQALSMKITGLTGTGGGADGGAQHLKVGGSCGERQGQRHVYRHALLRWRGIRRLQGHLCHPRSLRPGNWQGRGGMAAGAKHECQTRRRQVSAAKIRQKGEALASPFLFWRAASRPSGAPLE